MSYHDPLLGWQGKKIFGDPHTDRIKILVVGDSYTDGEGADETKMYYRVLAKHLNAELFVYAAGGYGTVQEYLVVDKYIDEIRPHLIVLQVCSNDFINNSWEIEKGSFSNNNLLVRPYWIDGEIKYYYPRFMGQYRVFLATMSRLAYMTFNSIDLLLADLAAKGRIRSTDAYIQEKGLAYKPFAASKQTMIEMVRMMKERAGGVPIVATPTDTDVFYTQQFEDVFAAAGVHFTTRPAAALEQAKAGGNDFSLGRKGHWNAQGHQIIGQALLEEILGMIQSNTIRLPVR